MPGDHARCEMAKVKQKILIVEDSRLNQEVLCRILQEEYKLVIATDGNEALEKVKNEHPDLILLDIVLPGMDGFEVLTILKKGDSTHSIPVIIISAMTKPEDEVKGLTLGAVDYISKPFNEVVVKTRIETQFKILNQMRIIEQLGYVDTLTGIPNRRQFDRDLMKEWKRAKRESTPLGMLMIDVDHFKMYNDTYGHPQGDVALQTVADAVVSSLKRSSDIAARWGGEEFAVLLPNTSKEGVLTIAESIRKSVEEATITAADGKSHHNVTISIGVALMFPGKENNITDLILQADEALYEAKDHGRNRVYSSI